MNILPTIVRVRKHLNRYEVSSGECFYGVHLGKRSLYFKKGSSRAVSVRRIADYKGIESIAS